MNKNKIKRLNFKIDEITLVFIVAVIAVIVVVYNKLSEPTGMEAEKITEMILDEHSISFANNGIVDENKLEEIKNMGYDEFKKSLNVKNDFCIYLEDGNGNIILAKGSSKLNDDGLYCKE